MTSPGTMSRGGPATIQKVVHASSRKASHSDAGHCRPPTPVPRQFSITPTLRATKARNLSTWRRPATQGESSWRLGAESQPERAGSRRMHPTRCAPKPRDINIWASKPSAARKCVLAGVPRETSQTLVGRNFLNTTVSALRRSRAGPTP